MILVLVLVLVKLLIIYDRYHFIINVFIILLNNFFS